MVVLPSSGMDKANMKVKVWCGSDNMQGSVVELRLLTERAETVAAASETKWQQKQTKETTRRLQTETTECNTG